MNGHIRKLLEEIAEYEKYCKELEQEMIQHTGRLDEDLLERYLRTKLTAAKQYSLMLDRKLQTGETA